MKGLEASAHLNTSINTWVKQFRVQDLGKAGPDPWTQTRLAVLVVESARLIGWRFSLFASRTTLTSQKENEILASIIFGPTVL
jgi:hypothetical protein